MSFHPKMAYDATFHKAARTLADEGAAFVYTAEHRARLDEIAGNVLDFRAADGKGAALPSDKIDKQTWEIGRPADGTVVVSYRIYANEKGTPYAARLNSDMAHANLASILGYAPERQPAPASLEIVPFRGWKVACSLAAAGEPSRFKAPDFDALAGGDQQLDQNQRRLDAGVGTEVEVLQSEADLATRREDLIEREMAVRDAADVLKMRLFPGTDELYWEAEIEPTCQWLPWLTAPAWNICRKIGVPALWDASTTGFQLSCCTP